MIKEMTDLQDKMNKMKLKLKKKDKKIEEISFNIKIQDNENKETYARIEKDTKYGLKVTLGVKQTAHDNQYEIRNLKRTVESHALKLNSTRNMGGT